MRLIKTMSKQDLLMASVDLVSKTYIELGQNNVDEAIEIQNSIFEKLKGSFQTMQRLP